MRVQLKFPKAIGRAQGVYQRLKMHGKAFSHTIHTAAQIYAAAQPILRNAGVDTATMDRGLSKSYDAYKMLEQKAQETDKSLSTVAQFLRPHFSGY